MTLETERIARETVAAIASKIIDTERRAYETQSALSAAMVQLVTARPAS